MLRDIFTQHLWTKFGSFNQCVRNIKDNKHFIHQNIEEPLAPQKELKISTHVKPLQIGKSLNTENDCVQLDKLDSIDWYLKN